MLDFKDEQHQGDFNSGLGIIFRLDGYYKAYAKFGLIKDYYSQYRMLKEIYSEILPMMDKEERIQHEKYNRHVTDCYLKIIASKNNRAGIPLNVINSFDEWKIKLKETEHVHGMGMPKKRDPRYAMG